MDRLLPVLGILVFLTGCDMSGDSSKIEEEIRKADRLAKENGSPNQTFEDFIKAHPPEMRGGVFEDYERPGPLEELKASETQLERFYHLGDAAKREFENGNFEIAKKYSEELLELAKMHEQNWNYGNAIQDGNLVLGRLAIQDGNVEDAKKLLIEAGSGKLNSFGPDMNLAKELLEQGEDEAVLKYLQLCSKRWKLDRGQTLKWSQEIQKGKIPEFKQNLMPW